MATDAELVEAFLRRTHEMTQMDAADAAGVSQRSVSRWRAGDRGKLHKTTRSQLAKFLRGEEETPEDAVGGWRETADPAESPEVAMFGVIFDDVVRTLRSFGDPGDNPVRKRAALDGMADYLATKGPLPDWWYEIDRKLKAGEY